MRALERVLSPRPWPQRVALGAACGVLAWVFNSVPANFISPEAPAFVFGGIWVLLAFRVLGPGPGIVATVLGFATASTYASFSAQLVLVFALEGLVASHLARRTRSLAVADALHWLTVGAFVDAVIFVWWVGLTPGLVLLVLLKQLLNGVVNAVAADALASAAPVRRALRLAPEPRRAWQEVLFDRSVPLVMVPMSIIVLLLTRASHAAVQNRITGELRQAAMTAERSAADYFRSRVSALELLRGQLSALPAYSNARADSLLDTFLAQHHEFLNVYLADANGMVLASAPLGSSTGAPLRGRDISRRAYFAAVRETDREQFGDLVLGQLHIRASGVEPVIPIAVPASATGGAFRGVVMGALDASALGLIIGARVRATDVMRAGVAQVLDSVGRVVVSSSPDWHPGDPRAPELGTLLGGHGEARPLVPGDGGPVEFRVHVEPRLTITQRVSSFPFLVLVDEPLSTVHRDLIPILLGLIAAMLLALLAVYVVPRRLGYQASEPLQAIAAVAETLAGGQSAPRAVLDRLRESPVQEIHLLGADLIRLDDALQARQQADAKAMQLSESRYRETLEQLAQAQKMEGIGRLAGGIAHDFNNLLTPIVGYTDLALASVGAESPARRDMQLVRTAAGKAKEVVAQLLAFGRAQVLDLKRVDLADIVLEFEPLLRKSLSVSHDLHISVASGVVVQADKAKMQQVLMNLVLNAADAMPKGGRIDVRVELATLGESAPTDPEPLPAGEYGVVTVEDHGVGMDELTRRRAFDPFFTTKPRGKGTGLGLSTAYGIVRQHNGTIALRSVPGVGTEMRVVLPLIAADQAGASPSAPLPEVRAPEAPLPAATDQAPYTVLVVEDEAPVRELVRAALVRQGYRVLAAREGEEALTRAAAYEGRIDLLLTDVLLPGVNGREVARRFRIVRPTACVLFMSGYASDVISEQDAVAADAELLVKPFTPDELLSRVRDALARAG